MKMHINIFDFLSIGYNEWNEEETIDVKCEVIDSAQLPPSEQSPLKLE